MDLPFNDSVTDPLIPFQSRPWQDSLPSTESLDLFNLNSAGFDQALVPSIGEKDFDQGPSAGDDVFPPRFQVSLLVKVINLYLGQIHPSLPMFKSSELIDSLARGKHRTDRRLCAMVLALCAFTLLQPQQPNASLLTYDMPAVSDFLREALNLHSATDLGEDSALDTILPSLYLFAAFDLLKQKKAT
jgi:hypothetical protein